MQNIALVRRTLEASVWVVLAAGVAACGAENPSPMGGAGGAAAGVGGQPQGGAAGMQSGAGGAPSGGAGGQVTAGAGGQGGGGDGGSMAGAGGIGGMASGGVGGMTGGDGGGGGGGVGGMSGDGGTGGTGGDEPDPVCELPDPSELEPSNVGGGGSNFEESDHFRLFGNASNPDEALNHLEAAHKCFVEDWCWRSPGLSVHSDDGPTTKFNVYAVGGLGGAAGVMRYDAGAGISYLEVVPSSAPDPRVIVHELGHALTLTEYGWVDQLRTGAWWETVANWVADTYLTSRHCEEARTAFGVEEGNTNIDLGRSISNSWQLIVNDQNYYQAWPFFTYLTNNPDGYPGLGRMALPNLFRNHPRNNDSPLHVLELIAAPIKVQTILGRYWARMAYLDIGHPKAQAAFFSARGGLNFANLDSTGANTYRVKASRQPQYGGANITPLNVTAGSVAVEITNMGGGNFTATLAIRDDDVVRYVDLPDGVGEATVAAGEEVSLVVANTPDELIQYNAFETAAGDPELDGLDYQVELTGAAPTD
jgi:hypothetical protein